MRTALMVIAAVLVASPCLAQMPPPVSSGPIIPGVVTDGGENDLAMWVTTIGWHSGFSGMSLISIGGPLTRDQIRRNYQFIASTPTTDVLAYQTMWFVIWYSPDGIARVGMSVPRY